MAGSGCWTSSFHDANFWSMSSKIFPLAKALARRGSLWWKALVLVPRKAAARANPPEYGIFGVVESCCIRVDRRGSRWIGVAFGVGMYIGAGRNGRSGLIRCGLLLCRLLLLLLLLLLLSLLLLLLFLISCLCLFLNLSLVSARISFQKSSACFVIK